MNTRPAIRGFSCLIVLAATFACHDAYAPTVLDFGARVSLWMPDSAATVAHEYYSGLTGAARLVITNAADWASAWAQVYAPYQPQPGRPEVDFAVQSVLVTALGERSTGGYDIRIDSVLRFEGGSVVYVTTAAPGQHCITTQALSQPAHLVRLARPVPPVVFQTQALVRDCS